MARKLKSDRVLFTATFLLVCASIVMVYSASALVALERFQQPYLFLNKQALWAVLDPEVVLHADHAAVAAGAEAEARGARAVAGTFAGRARFARPALVEGAVGAVWAPGGRPRVVFTFTVRDGRVAEIRLMADPERLAELDLVPLG